jgi:DNA-directed RNA polymerase subunit RPC12/RpoP
MDIVFKCPHCEQELEVDDRGVGSTLECPACSNTITVPARPPGGAAPAPAEQPPKSSVAAFHESKHFSVPTHDAPADALIQKSNRPLEVAALEGDKKMRIKTFKRADCQEVGKDKFDEKVSNFLQQVGQLNVISINTINYSALDMATHIQVHDYGVLIVFKG